MLRTQKITRKSGNEQSPLKNKKEQSFFKRSVCRSCQVSTSCIGETKDLTKFVGNRQGRLLHLRQVSAVPTERGGRNTDFSKQREEMPV